MITIDKEFYSSPYYFFLRDKGKDYSLYFSAEKNLNEARKKDEMIKVPKDKVKQVKDYLEKLLNSKKNKSTKELKGEIEELVNIDGAMSNSKIPILDPRLHPKKTMDQTVAAARITNDPIARGYRTYYGESIEEVSEEDLSKAFGYEETSGKTPIETIKIFDKMGVDNAVERADEFGKDPKLNKKKKKGSDMRIRITEKEKIEERNKLVSEINQLRYGVYPEAIAILKKIQDLREGGGGRDRDIYYYSSSSSSLKTINMDINTMTNNIELKRAEKTKHEAASDNTQTEIQDEKQRILRDILGTTGPIPDVSRAYSEAMLALTGANRDRVNKANELVELLRRKRDSERREILRTEDDIKKKERDLKDLNTRKEQIDREIKKQELALEDYTLRTYLYKITDASLITKYTSTGKKNQQFALLERKGYNESVKGSSEYRKNADQMIKDTPMFSQASCLQKKTEIQTMFDSMLSRAKETVVNAIDNQIGGAPDPVPEPVLFPELRKKYAELEKNYENFNVLKDFVFHEDEPPNEMYFTYTDRCDSDIDCTATIKANESPEDKKRKGEEDKEKFERMTKISLGTYPPLLMPRGYYKMHQMVYYESSTVVDLECEKPPPPFNKELTISNLDMVLNPSKIPMSFPALMTDNDNFKYNKSIKEKYLFSPIEIEFST